MSLGVRHSGMAGTVMVDLAMAVQLRRAIAHWGGRHRGLTEAAHGQGQHHEPGAQPPHGR